LSWPETVCFQFSPRFSILRLGFIMSVLRLWLFSAIVCCVATSAQAAIVYTVSLSGPAENPSNNSPGIGSGTVTFDDALSTMRVQVTFSGLTGTTTASHIHSSATNAPGVGNAGVATQLPSFVGFPLGVTSGSMDQTYDMSQASSYNPTFVTNNGGTPAAAFSALLAQSAEGRAYLNIHTSTFTPGEIRGFLTAVPEPSGVLLTSGLLLALTFARRRQAKHVKSFL
jgi:hypothetical protein